VPRLISDRNLPDGHKAWNQLMERRHRQPDRQPKWVRDAGKRSKVVPGTTSLCRRFSVFSDNSKPVSENGPLNVPSTSTHRSTPPEYGSNKGA
jgi:hypothetical protein